MTDQPGEESLDGPNDADLECGITKAAATRPRPPVLVAGEARPLRGMSLLLALTATFQHHDPLVDGDEEDYLLSPESLERMRKEEAEEEERHLTSHSVTSSSKSRARAKAARKARRKSRRK